MNEVLSENFDSLLSDYLKENKLKLESEVKPAPKRRGRPPKNPKN